MSEPRRCPQCEAEIPANSPIGLCPRCLLKPGTDSQSVAGSAEPGPTKLTPPASGFVPPTVEELAPLFPQLEILELLGKGGMGAVYKARQPGLDRLVAVKILPPEISHDPAFTERFQREARALARLSHPHIVAVYDFGVVGQAFQPDRLVAQRQAGKPDLRDGLCYIVMEFVDGANLRQAMRTGTLTSVEALAIVPQICEALQFAHDEGIVHRDIKPENILIDKRGRVKIADFGLAKLLGADASDHSLTATHQVMGTLRYMAPEQMQGSRAVDHRADIYSLGVVFYELLTGELPMGKFAPPSKRVQVDVRLDEVVLRALEQDPEQRYQHASDVKTDVETISRESQSPNHAAQKPAHQDGQTTRAEPVSLPFEIAESVHWGLFGEVHGKLRLGKNELVVEFEVRSLFPAFRSGLTEVSIPFDDIEFVNWDGWDLTLHTKTMKALAEIPKSSQGQVAFDLSFTDLDVPGGISEPVEHFLACLPRRLVAESAGVTDPSTRESPTEPRFSRFAIAGAVWALFGVLAVIPTLFFIGLNRVWNGTALPTDLIHEQPPLPFLLLMIFLLAIGSGAPIGTTILGASAIGHIKRSGGKIVGLPLAVVDVLFFPLLVVFAGIAVPVSLALHSLLPLQMIAVAVPSAMFALIVCLVIGFAVWRKVIPDSALTTTTLREKLRFAGIALLIAGIMDAVSGLVWIGHNVSVLVELLKQGTPIGWQVASMCLSLCSLWIVYYVVGVALHLMTLEDDGDFTFCLLTAAIVPPGCLIGLPAAIYAMVQLSKPEVKALIPAKPSELAAMPPDNKHETAPSKWEVAVQTWWLARSNNSRKVLWIALNCLCAFCIFAFLSFKGVSDTDHNTHFQIGFLDPWFVFESNQGPGKHSVSGITLAWSWLFGIGAYGSGWLLIKLKSVRDQPPIQ